ncbi:MULTISPECIES: pantoate--beta-alanine ligase [Pseudoalteromonas]|uniref:Pantothenate synthetase n=1 Tax=Pseudoalteromonas rhizosphaerae TaxID=2518973 RepID=A0ABW8KV56_9GAMM|nr:MULTISPECIES: pantoate--beta-alanine ligase [unclassified Pseudoalteromonas]MBB1293253.1 pantoate--beta-alanine ligase [Pseudoalteromonas sp. SR41-4]MBB1331689.1 pantoate--beta-alanine ligase [Pseudoalteromonas sp. SR41-6]MBB1341673.1 pantoate--beta-alanine ligase [Pseudoalteromonas sp. SR45-6]MBB1458707.1 pantoate--beta-alanine ligase [Pseudoalteromonas sp. SG41-8]MBB1467016.1 pantoate--beta-alanine ligase [Pseudoalteromonas sp. SG41-5]|tara:strand:- start:11712 stop:12563 length:852 start_codon:yes stop_codon:yes gene_type:complete
MQSITEIKSLRSQIKAWRQAGLSVALVPTMGNLHQGHFSLVEKAKNMADKVVVSIFVNPMQFGVNEDLDNYPRTLIADKQGLAELGTDIVFTPSVEAIYPNGLDAQSFVDVPNISMGYCGGSRPGHFRGVATVVTKLFNLVQPDYACFGEKDYQQLQVIKTMAHDLSIPVEIIGVATSREVSGLAMSSRNGYLSEAQKETATVLFKTLNWSAEQLNSGQRDFDDICRQAKQQLEQAGLKIDYFEIAQRDTLKKATLNDSQLVILAAAFLGPVRLIDNLLVDIT